MSVYRKREYPNYEQYLEHQKVKTLGIKDIREKKNLDKIKSKRVNGFSKIFAIDKQDSYLKENDTVLCLGARTGEEVVALNNIGMKALGVDLVPTLPLVVEGDFNNLNFPTESYDIIYTNSIDHAWDVDMVLKGVKRILKTNGYFIIDFYVGNISFNKYEVICIENIQDMICIISKYLRLIKQYNDMPSLYKKFKGVQLVFQK